MAEEILRLIGEILEEVRPVLFAIFAKILNGVHEHHPFLLAALACVVVTGLAVVAALHTRKIWHDRFGDKSLDGLSNHERLVCDNRISQKAHSGWSSRNWWSTAKENRMESRGYSVGFWKFLAEALSWAAVAFGLL